MPIRYSGLCVKALKNDVDVMRRQLIFIGIVIGLAAGIGYILMMRIEAVAGVVFGSAITLNNMFLQHLYMRRAKRLARADAEHNLRLMMSCSIQRFIATVVLFALGMGALQLPPLAVIGGFGVALIAQYVTDPNFKTLRK